MKFHIKKLGSVSLQLQLSDTLLLSNTVKIDSINGV
jgi:hypothetical protein